MYGHLQIEPIEVELGYSLVELINVEKGGDLLKRIVMLRRSFATDLGLVVPPVRIRDNITLSPDSYAIRIFDQVAGKGELMPGKFLVLGADLENARRQMEVIETREPAFGLPALWVGERDREKAEILGYTVIDCPSVLATHISEVIKSRAADILTRQDVQSLVDNLKAAAPVVVSELIPSLMKIGEVQKVLQNLLKEGVSIKNLRLILETLGDHAPCSKEICYLTNQVRIALARSICDEYRLTGNVMPVITLSPRVESIILGALAESTQNDYFGLLGPDLLRSLYTNLTRAVQRATAAGYQPVIVCSGSVRMPFRNLTERAVKKIVVLSFNEIVDDCSLEVLEVVDVDDSAIEGCEREIKAACA
jgi:flagellar biosynthesis protein FlhA